MPRDDRTLPTSQTVEHTIDGFSLVVKAGPDAGKHHVAAETEVSIGTDPSSDLTLGDSRVSRHHATVTATKRGFLLRDLGSRNGTWVAGTRIESAYIFDGATFEVGHTLLRLQKGESIREELSLQDRFGRIVGSSEAMRRIFAILPRIAASESTVLIDGETGTGKGLLAAAIHETSNRAKGPFVVLDCTAIPPTLVESELFGHVAGSFTGASRDRQGAFELAKGGTIFIDEIGELPADMQPKLLRALEERTVKPVGGTRRVQLDVRVIAATNRDLRTEVNEGTFRADLYYRLNIVRLHVPPLRERRDDIVLLAKHFHEELAPGRALSPKLLAQLVRQTFPGNVRELRGAVERGVLLEDLDMDSLEPSAGAHASEKSAPTSDAGAAQLVFDPSVPFRDAKAVATSAWEKWYLGELLRFSGGNLSKASRVVQMDRSYLRALVRKHGASVPTSDEE
ncbi:MAG: sigma 54-interacting transcriptional regulator [Polyangiaceae bacterium]